MSSQERRERADLPPAERVLLEMREDLQADHTSLLNFLLKKDEDYINQTAAGRITAQVWGHLPNADARQRRFDDLLRAGMWKLIGVRKSMKQACIPVLETKAEFKSVLDLSRRDQAGRVFPELFDRTKISSHSRSEEQFGNLTCMADYFRLRVAACSRKGRLPTEERKKKDDAQKMLDKLENYSKMVEKLHKELTRGRACKPAHYTHAARVYDLLEKEAVYDYKNSLRSRRYTVGASYQALPRLMRRRVMPDCLLDFDIRAAQWAFMVQLVDRLGVVLPPGFEDFPFTRSYAKDSTAVRKALQEQIGCDAKPLLLAILNGGGLPDDLQHCKSLVQLRDESRLLRWLFSAVYPEGLAQAASDGRPWPEATAMYYAWTAGEDCVVVRRGF